MAEHTNSLVLDVCPTKLSGKHDKRYQKTKCAEIIKAINGLYNSGGGTIILRYKKAPPRKHVENCVRMLEQKIQEFLGTITLTCDVQFIKIQPSYYRAHGEMKIIVTTTTKTKPMTPLHYNMFLPSNQLVMEILPHENEEKLRRFLVENTPSVTAIESGSHCQHFVTGTIVPFSESKMIQFKKVEDKPAAKTTFADRLICNKFPCYVSAFANYAGGHMYVGIDDEGKVEGEVLTEDEKEKVKNSIRKVIKKMKWPKKCEPADEKSDERWDIHFEPVKDREDNIIPSLYVVVIFIAQCRPAGVFTEEPECYEIVDNHRVQKVDFATWKRTIDPRLADEGTSCLYAPWELVYEDLTGRLNSNCNHDELHAASKTAQEKYKISDVELTCLSKLISFHLRKGDYDKAEEVLTEYSKILPKSKSHTRAKVMEQYLYSIMARCKGEYKKSYEIAVKCLSDLKKLPVSTMSAAFYVQIATLENILAMQTKKSKEMISLFCKAEKTYDIAKSHLDQLQAHSITKAEYQQKIYINKALLYLGCSLSADILPHSESCIDIKKAQDYLSLTQEIVIHQGYRLSKFRKIQNLFAYACLSYRMANDNQSRCTELLKHAVDYSKEAESLARDLGFAEMITYAKKFIELFEPKLKPSS